MLHRFLSVTMTILTKVDNEAYRIEDTFTPAGSVFLKRFLLKDTERPRQE